MSFDADQATFVANHLPFDDQDHYGLKLVLEDWARKDFEGDLNVSSAADGYITITSQNWVPRHPAPFVSFEIHKLKGKKRLFWQGCHWAVRFFTCESIDGAFPRLSGCMGPFSTLFYAMNAAPWDGWNGQFFGMEKTIDEFYLN